MGGLGKLIDSMDNSTSNEMNLDIIKTSVINSFKKKCNLNCIWAFEFYQGTKFEFYVFFENNNDIILSRSKGLTGEIEKYIEEELNSSNFVNHGEFDLIVEFDSNQNVQKKFNGNYYNRLL